ncbi:MAG: histidine phosphatase family protein [Capsulimonadaceae bacterium]|nr:histidine phosphatase family protein [Capsulimonadaceae bacterium]
MQLLIARHGQTVWNVERRIQGWGDSPLTDEGRAQARQLGARLSGVDLAGVYSSDLGRAIETAKIIADGRDVVRETLFDLRETSWGEWEGKTGAEIDAAEPERWARFISRGRAMNEEEDDTEWETTTAVPGGETLVHACARIASALKAIRAAHPGDDEQVLVVGHGGSLRFFITLALGLPPRRIRRMTLDNASLTRILYLHGHPPIIQCINDTGHHGGDAK